MDFESPIRKGDLGFGKSSLKLGLTVYNNLIYIKVLKTITLFSKITWGEFTNHCKSFQGNDSFLVAQRSLKPTDHLSIKIPLVVVVPNDGISRQVVGWTTGHCLVSLVDTA